MRSELHVVVDYLLRKHKERFGIDAARIEQQGQRRPPTISAIAFSFRLIL